MHRYLISVFYKQQPERPTIDQLLHPENLQSGDRFNRVFQREMEFSYSSTDHLLDELFATFNGHGKALPPNTLLPRSICIGDIVLLGKETCSFLVTPTGFERLAFAPRDENFEITHTLSSLLPTTTRRNLYAL